VRRLFLTLLLTCILTALGAQDAVVFPAQRERARRETLIAALSQRGVAFEERPLLAGYGGFGASVFVSLRTQAAQGTLALAIPLSGRAEQGFDAELPFDIEAGLAFIEQARATVPTLNILVAFLADEVSLLPEGEGRPHLGLHDLFDTLDSPENTVLLYLDMKKAPTKLLVRHGAAGFITARNVVEAIPALCKRYNLPWAFAVRHNELHKLGLVDGDGAFGENGVIREARELRINALYLEAAQGYSGTIPVERMSDFLTAYTTNLIINAENFDYHFLIVYLLGWPVIISESWTLTTLILLLSLSMFALLVYTIMYRKRWIIKALLFLRCVWVLPLFVVVMILCLEVAGSLVMLASRSFGVEAGTDYGRAAFKLLIALCFFSLFWPLERALRIRRKTAFYGTAATLLASVAVLNAAFLDITFIPLFLLGFIVILAGAFVRKPLVVYLCTLCLPCLSVGAFLNMVSASGQTLPFAQGPLAALVLSDSILTSLYFSVVILPLMLILERGNVLAYEQRQLRYKSSAMALLVRRLLRLLAILLISVAFFVVYLLGLARIPHDEPTRRSVSDVESAFLSVTTQTEVFLERKTVKINVAASGKPLRFDMYLESADENAPEPYSAPMPLLKRDALAFLLGEGPPNPLITEVVLPVAFTGYLRVDALYTAWDAAIDAQAPPTSADYLLTVSTTVPVN
jgi:hypothetical protein